MKLKINKNVRAAMFVIFSVIILAVLLLAYREYTTPHFREDKLSLYKYSSKGAVSYNAGLKRNILYSQPSLPEGSIYITEFVDTITATFNYDFSGERAAQIKGDYAITAVVEGYNNEDKGGGQEGQKDSGKDSGQAKGPKVLWKKEFVLTPKTSFQTAGKTASVTKGVALKYEEYSSFAKKVLETARLNTPTRLSVLMNVNLKAETDSGPVEEQVSQSMVIPLGTSSFEIIKNELKENQKALEETKKVRLPVNMNLILLYCIIGGIVSAALIGTAFFTSSEAGTDPYLKALDKIFKSHGSRLAALSSEIAATSENTLTVRSMEDLVRISDETQKPILYPYSTNSEDISRFHVYDGNLAYVFDLKDAFHISRQEKKAMETSRTEAGKKGGSEKGGKPTAQHGRKSGIKAVPFEVDTAKNKELEP